MGIVTTASTDTLTEGVGKAPIRGWSTDRNSKCMWYPWMPRPRGVGKVSIFGWFMDGHSLSASMDTLTEGGFVGPWMAMVTPEITALL